ncbi:hypothetical protein GCM10010129_70240 [Streptomyces fumigatiscleroticus]|nr:hypothetical protein GCM10010129_70240 [Streptomyces fumigatiscleroticus]
MRIPYGGHFAAFEQPREDDETAARLFEKALSAPGVDAWPYDRARVHLAQGERLLRAGAAEAGSPLMSAHEPFRRLGAPVPGRAGGGAVAGRRFERAGHGRPERDGTHTAGARHRRAGRVRPHEQADRRGVLHLAPHR